MKKIIKLTIIQLVFLALSFALLLFIRSEVGSYLQTIRSLGPEIEYARQQAELSEDNVLPAYQLLKKIEGPTNRIQFLSFIGFPVMFYLLWAAFQGHLYAEIKRIKKKKKFFLHYALLSAGFFLVMTAIIFNVLKPQTLAIPSPSSFLPFLVLFSIAYVLVTLMTTSLHESLTRAFYQLFSLESLKKIPGVLLLCVLAIFQAGAIAYLYLLVRNASSASAYVQPLLLLIIAAFFSTAIKEKIASQ